MARPDDEVTLVALATAAAPVIEVEVPVTDAVVGMCLATQGSHPPMPLGCLNHNLVLTVRQR